MDKVALLRCTILYNYSFLLFSWLIYLLKCSLFLVWLNCGLFSSSFYFPERVRPRFSAAGVFSCSCLSFSSFNIYSWCSLICTILFFFSISICLINCSIISLFVAFLTFKSSIYCKLCLYFLLSSLNSYYRPSKSFCWTWRSFSLCWYVFYIDYEMFLYSEILWIRFYRPFTVS